MLWLCKIFISFQSFRGKSKTRDFISIKLLIPPAFVRAIDLLLFDSHTALYFIHQPAYRVFFLLKIHCNGAIWTVCYWLPYFSDVTADALSRTKTYFQCCVPIMNLSASVVKEHIPEMKRQLALHRVIFTLKNKKQAPKRNHARGLRKYYYPKRKKFQNRLTRKKASQCAAYGTEELNCHSLQ